MARVHICIAQHVIGNEAILDELIEFGGLTNVNRERALEFGLVTADSQKSSTELLAMPYVLSVSPDEVKHIATRPPPQRMMGYPIPVPLPSQSSQSAKAVAKAVDSEAVTDRGPIPVPGRENVIHQVDVSGYLFPRRGAFPGVPSFLSMRSCDDAFLPVFSTKEKLVDFCTTQAIPYEGITHIDNGAEFLSSFLDHKNIRIIVDPTVNPSNGKWRFVEIFLTGN